MSSFAASLVPGLRLGARWPLALLACLVTSAAAAEDASLKIAQSDNSVTVTRDGKSVLQYVSVPSPMKPYVKELFTPGGVQVLRDSPHDHKHHHALMFAIGVNNVDFWGEAAGAGTQKSVGVSNVKAAVKDGAGKAGFVQELNWVEPRDAKTLLVERRAVEVVQLSRSAGKGASSAPPCTLVHWNSQLSAPPGMESVKLTAEGHHYYGLGMRFLVSMDEGGRFFNSSGQPSEVVRGSERLTPAKWCAYTAKADGRPVTIAVFDHPKNPRHPNKIFTMAPFAYLSATLNLWKEPLVLKPGQALDLRWGVALWDGETPAEQVEAAYRQWAEAQ